MVLKIGINFINRVDHAVRFNYLFTFHVYEPGNFYFYLDVFSSLVVEVIKGNYKIYSRSFIAIYVSGDPISGFFSDTSNWIFNKDRDYFIHLLKLFRGNKNLVTIYNC